MGSGPSTVDRLAQRATTPDRDSPVSNYSTRNDVRSVPARPPAGVRPAEALGSFVPVDNADTQIRSRLLSVLSVLEHEGDALRDVDDMRIHGALHAMQQTKAEIVAAVAALGNPPQNGPT